MPTNDKQKGLYKLYWYMLSINEEYRKDYNKYAETNQGEAEMTVMWAILHTFNDTH